MHPEKSMGGLVFAGGLTLLAVLLGAGMVAAAENPEKAPAAEAPALPGVPPMVRRSVDELPTGPETPADQLPPDYFAALGTVYLHYNQWGKAEECFREAYQKEKDASRRGPCAYHLGQLLVRKGEHGKALPLIQEAVQSAQADTRLSRRYLFTLATLHEKMGQPDKAEATYDDAVAKSAPGYERDLARRALAAFLRRTGKLDATIARNEAILKEKPDDKEAIETLQLIYSSVQPDADKALAMLERLVAADPGNRDTALRLASAYEQARKFDKAIEVVRRLIDKNPGEAGSLTSRLTQLIAQGGKKDEALAYAKGVLAKAPESSDAHLQAAGIYRDLSLVDNAVAEFETAARLAKDDKQRDHCLLSAAQAARLGKRYPKAEELARKLMQSQSKPVATLAKRLLFDIYSEQNKVDQLDVKPEAP